MEQVVQGFFDVANKRGEPFDGPVQFYVDAEGERLKALFEQLERDEPPGSPQRTVG